MTQRIERQTLRKSSGIGDLQTISKQHHLNAGVAGVVPMCHGIDDPFRHHIPRNLIGDGGLRILRTRADSGSNLRHHKINRLIHQLKHVALVCLVERYRLGNFSAVEMSTLDFRGREKLLWLFSKQHHGSVCRIASLQ